MANEKETLLWSIAFPGFGQFLNGEYIKGVTLIFLELLVNVQANFNKVIILSFHGDIEKAIIHADYQWLMFYPCLYSYAMWDAFKGAGGGKYKYPFLPFVFSAYFVTVGCIYSFKLRLFGVLLGPVWLPMLCLVPGLAVRVILKIIMKKGRIKAQAS